MNHAKFLVIAMLALTSFACSAAEYEVKHPGVHIKGKSAVDGESATAAAANAYATIRAADANKEIAEAEAEAIKKRADAQTFLAEGYATALERGTVAPYGYGQGGDRAYYFNGVVGVQPSQTAPSGSAGSDVDARSKRNEETLRRLEKHLREQK